MARAVADTDSVSITIVAGNGAGALVRSQR